MEGDHFTDQGGQIEKSGLIKRKPGSKEVICDINIGNNFKMA